jgi:biotin carboxylase
MTNILILEPSTSGFQLLPTAYSMGLKIFVLSANQDERIIPAEYNKYIFEKIDVDTNNFSAICQAALKLHEKYQLSAIIPGFEIYVSLAARLAQFLKLPGVSVETGEALRNKAKMRDKLAEKNVRIPKYKRLDSANHIKDIASYIGFPCVIKPIDQSGSVHVAKLNNISELTAAYSAMCNDPWTEMNKGIGTTAIVEEYVEGEEFSVEGYISENTIHIVSITKKFLTPEPLFIEMGHIVPANITQATQEIIQAYTREVVTALNINLGVFHAELRVSKNGPVLMEIAGRLPGCRICDLILLAKNINLYEVMIKSHLNWAINTVPTENLQYAGMCYFDLNGKNSFAHISGVEDLQKMPGFYDFKLFKNSGEYVPPLTTFQGRVAACVFTASNYTELLARLACARSTVLFFS